MPGLSCISILVADDFKGWRRQVHSLLQVRSAWQIIAEASDGSEAVQKAEDLKPDLIVLDIGLPKLNATTSPALMPSPMATSESKSPGGYADSPLAPR